MLASLVMPLQSEIRLVIVTAYIPAELELPSLKP